jgi:hypothetical protein
MREKKGFVTCYGYNIDLIAEANLRHIRHKRCKRMDTDIDRLATKEISHLLFILISMSLCLV